MIGKRIGGRYQIIRELGGGGFGKTFVAQDQHLPGTPACVVKQLKPQTAGSSTLEAARRLFNREAKFLYQLGTHERIPQLFAHFEEDQEFYLVQELIEGHELKQELPPYQSPLTEVQVITLLQEILEVLGFVHQHNVIHRDLKPSNLLRRHSDHKLVLIDFGAVKQVSTKTVHSSHHTSFTIAIGSPGYMPSEQLAGKPRFCSDIYAVGMIGIQALTGTNPSSLPEDPNTGEIIWREGMQVSQTFAGILDKMICYDFRDRYQSVAEILENLELLQSRRLATFSSIPVIAGKPQLTLSAPKSIFIDDLTSECGIDYTKLRDFLAEGNWREADEETRLLMLKITNREKEGLIKPEDIKTLSKVDFQTLNSLWMNYSNGRFGLKIQKQLYEYLGGTQNYEIKMWRKFCERVGWYVDGHWVEYKNLILSTDAPVGCLPVLTWMVYETVLSILFQVDFDESKILTDHYCTQKVSYQQLINVLAVGDWKKADHETYRIILKSAGREESGFLRASDIKKISCKDLEILNELWLKYSQGKFGFRVQQEIWKKIICKEKAYEELERDFGDYVRWRINGKWINYDDLNFNLEAGKGYLPRRCFWGIEGLRWSVGMDAPRMILSEFFGRIDTCNFSQDASQIFSTNQSISTSENIRATKNIEYSRLQNLLAAGNWKQADAETKVLLLTIAGKELEEVLTSEDINQFPCQELQIIDELWFKYSNGKFGFSVQQRLWKNLGGSRNAHSQTICHFGMQVGWFVEGNWLLYDQLNFGLNAPEGHLPVADLRGKGRRIWGLIWAHLFDRIEVCQSHHITLTFPKVQQDRSKDKNDFISEKIPDKQLDHLIRNRIEVIQGDITQQNVDAIVNTTDIFFSGTGQVDRAIHQAAGTELRRECSKLGHIIKGMAKITQGYNLPAQWVIHTVGPTWRGGNQHEQEQLAKCYQNCLILAEKFSIQTIAFPAISTGSLFFPMKLSSRIAVTEVKQFLERNSSIEKVIFVCFNERAYNDYLQAVDEVLG
jgi:serine/threonine protein kinase/O-acetyl-ADP-ribose deacetylase (regulator of RNase III)